MPPFEREAPKRERSSTRRHRDGMQEGRRRLHLDGLVQRAKWNSVLRTSAILYPSRRSSREANETKLKASAQVQQNKNKVVSASPKKLFLLSCKCADALIHFAHPSLACCFLYFALFPWSTPFPLISHDNLTIHQRQDVLHCRIPCFDSVVDILAFESLFQKKTGELLQFLPRDAMQARSMLSCDVCLYVRLSRL